MAINFPTSPSIGQIYSFGGYSWQWNGSYWESYSPESFLSTTGGTVSGNTVFLSGLTATTISATTYQNLPTDISVTGATYSNNTFTYTNNTGGTYSVLFNTVTGLTVNGNLTITGNTTISGLTASQLIATDTNDTLVSLSTSTYPSLTELTYVKGLTASTQTQLNNKKDTFTIRPFVGTTNPADNVTYFFGEQTLSLSTNATLYDMRIPFNATLVGASIYAGNLTTNASNELSTLNFRLNNLTDTLLSNQISFGGTVPVSNVYIVTGLSTSVSVSDTFIMKWTTPTWVTNPAAAQFIVSLYFERL